MTIIDAVPETLANERTIFDARQQRPGKRNRAYGKFRRATKWPHDLAWLAGKLGLEADDPRLSEIALKLAEKGELVVYITKQGTVGDVGRPKERRRQ